MPGRGGVGLTSAKRPVELGGWKPISDVNEPHVKEVGAFAVSEHNKDAEKKLSFRRVVVGEKQVVAGIKYRLVVEVEQPQPRPSLRGLVVDDGNHEVISSYEAVVLERPWEGFRNLASFRPTDLS